jgi:tetratricopeptide (TPR) repeat protein
MDKDELIYRYFSNTLSPKAEEEFQSLLENDAAFKAQVEFERTVKRVTKKEQQQLLKEKLQTFEVDIQATEKKKKTTRFDWRIAASLAFFITVGWLLYIQFFNINYGKLYDQHYKIYPNDVYTITRGDTTDNSIKRNAFNAYEKGNYELALELFNDVEEDYTDFYKAQCYLQLDNLQEAERYFKKVLDQNEQSTAKAYWYLALIAIKQENSETAIPYLEKLTSQYEYQKSEATTLLKQLE